MGRIIELSRHVPKAAASELAPMPARRPLAWDVVATTMAEIRSATGVLYSTFTCRIQVDADAWTYELSIIGESGEDRTIRLAPRANETGEERRERMQRVLHISDMLGYCLGVPA